MRRILPFLIVLLAFSGIACPPTVKVEDKNKNKNGDGKHVETPIEVPNDLKKRIDLAIAQVQSRELLTTHWFWTVFHGILGSGIEKTTLKDPATGKVHNAIEYISDGGEIKGMQFIPTKHGLDVATLDPKGDRSKEGMLQGHQDQFIAEMAQWNMPIGTAFKVGGQTFKFSDFTNHSKMRASVTKGQELTWAIIIIAQYYETTHVWKNMYGEDLTFDDIVKYETEQPIEQAACGGTHRLFGLTWAYHLHMKKKGKKTEVWKDAEARINSYKERAKKIQQPGGSFTTDYFVGKGTTKFDDKATEQRIGTTGHIVEWLSLAMTDDELKSDWMQSAVNKLSLMILDMGNEPIDSGALYHAAHGLELYRMRVYGPVPSYLPLPPK